jgi:pyrimidine deaminase RibD-like protein
LAHPWLNLHTISPKDLFPSIERYTISRNKKLGTAIAAVNAFNRALVGKSKRQVLPVTVTPVNYFISLTPCFKSFSFDGFVEVILKINSPVDCITCNGNDLIIESASVLYDGILAESNEVSLDSKNETISMKFDARIPKGSAMLSIKFKGLGAKI